MCQRNLLLVAAVVVALATAAAATTIHVPSEQATIQAGIIAATSGDTVIVACGTYYEYGIALKSGVHLQGAIGQSDCVIVDAEEQGRVFFCDSVDSTAVVRGFTVTGGHVSWSDGNGGGMLCQNASSPKLVDVLFLGNSADNGGGLYCGESSSPSLADVTFSGNSADMGGGIQCHHSSPVLEGCSFTGNTAVYGGGGLDCYYSDATLNDCVFVDNSASPTYGMGGGIASGHSSLVVTDCTLSSNSASHYGGGIASSNNDTPTLVNVTFLFNSAQSGGALFCSNYATPTLEGCTFSENSAATEGAGMAAHDDCSLSAENCIIAFGTSGQSVCCDGTSDAALTCCDVYGNVGGDWVGCIASQYGENGNISEDPAFCRDLAPSEPYALDVLSPCASGNSGGCGTIGAWDAVCDSTPVERSSWGRVKAMYR